MQSMTGLMAALDEGGKCDGVVFRIAADRVELETRYMWRREMFAGSYLPLFQEVTTPQGAVDALVFVMDRSNSRYTPGLSEHESAAMIATAEGGLGPNFEYLESMVRHLEELEIEDDAMRRLYCRAVQLRSQAE